MSNRIAHRLSTIIPADRIVIFKDGEILEKGKHQDLIRSNSLYKEIYNKQFLIA